MDIIFKITGIGIITSIVNQILKQCGKEEIASIITLTGLIICLMMVLNLVKDLLSSVQNIFGF
ncbi:MAG: stage III sporulation protein AC [Clostridia bacterium]|nr:stage III sporulation protein AC [Clostridia bacterium]